MIIYVFRGRRPSQLVIVQAAGRGEAVERARAHLDSWDSLGEGPDPELVTWGDFLAVGITDGKTLICTEIR